MVIKNIIFDWSGTLSDDFKPVYDASMIVFGKLGRAPISFDQFRKESASPYMPFWNNYFPDLKKEDLDKFFLDAIYSVDEPNLYDDVKIVLNKLKLLNINIIVISAHPKDKLLKEAKHYGIESYFKEINGSVHDKIEVILEILKRNNFESNETVYVGDMTHDIDAGKNAKVKTVAVCWGYQPKEKLIVSNPDYIIDSISDLLDLVVKLNVDN